MSERFRPSFPYAWFSTSRIFSSGNASSRSVLRLRPTSLRAGNLRAADQDERARVVERGQDRPVQERRGVDHDLVVGRAGDLEETGELRVAHEVGVLRPKRRGHASSSPDSVPRRVPLELLRVESAGAEIRSCSVCSGWRPSTIAESPNWRSRSSRSVRFPCSTASTDARLVATTVFPIPPFGENTVVTLPSACSTTPVSLPPVRWARRSVKATFSTACGRRNVLLDAGVECLLEHGAGLVRRQHDDRGTGVLADRSEIVQPAGAGVRRVEDGLDAAALERRRRVVEERARLKDLDVLVLTEIREQLVQPVGRADHTDGRAAPRAGTDVLRERGHGCGPFSSSFSCGPLSPSVRIEPVVSAEPGLSPAARAGRSVSVQSAFLTT